MKLKKHFLLVMSCLTLAATTLSSVSSCGGGSGNGGNTDSGISDISTLTNDIELDEEGNVIFSGVQLEFWSIIGDPDLAVFRKVIDDFNLQYRGKIKVSLKSIGHFDFYNSLENTWTYDFENAPDVVFMHNEKTAEYASRGYLYPIDKIVDEYDYTFDFSGAYENIDRSQMYQGNRYGVPVDAHGWVTHFRQDILKKNGLGFENNTRFIPSSRAEYQELLEKIRAKADSAEGLLVRDIRKGENHAWKKLSGKELESFRPEFLQCTDPDGLGALYANNGRLASEDGKKILFHENDGVQTYLTDIVDRWNNKLMGEPDTDVTAFSKGQVLMFPQGPWWTSQNYDPNMNLKELQQAGNGVSEEDATDPVINTPLAASNSAGWWTLDKNIDTPNGKKWFGNGHMIGATRHITSATSALATLEFAKWFTQGKSKQQTYNLAEWSKGGHIPAWKTVYESEDYQNIAKDNLTLKALGNPEDIISAEPLQYETTILGALGLAVNNVINGLKSSTVKTREDALKILNDVALSAQGSLDLLDEDF